MDTRTFNLNAEQIKEVKEKKPPKIRKAADAWSTIDKSHLTDSQQLQILLDTNNNNNNIRKEMVKQITNKVHSYRSQDLKKSLLNPEQLVSTQYVVDLLCSSELLCYYCKTPTLILYDEVRAAKQWTLDRIDNSQGHNKGNVEIACLTCNLRRRTMYHERYVFTKQLNIVKLND